jgi:hypothetical protein
MMDTALPWVPAIDGNNLPILKRIADSVEIEEEPHARNDAPWAKKAVRESVAKSPHSLDVVWDCVVGIWRLKSKPSGLGEDGEDDLWAQHTIAWLVCWKQLKVRDSADFGELGSLSRGFAVFPA